MDSASFHPSESKDIMEILQSLEDVIALRKRNHLSKALKALKSIFRDLKCCDLTEDLETEEFKEKLHIIESQNGSVPTECGKLLGFVLLIIRCYDAHSYVVLCIIAGANAFEMAQFDVAFDFFLASYEFLNSLDEAPEDRVIVAVRNNMGCAKIMMRETVSESDLQHLLNETTSETCLHYIVANNLARAHLIHDNMDEAISHIIGPFNKFVLRNGQQNSLFFNDFGIKYMEKDNTEACHHGYQLWENDGEDWTHVQQTKSNEDYDYSEEVEKLYKSGDVFLVVLKNYIDASFSHNSAFNILSIVKNINLSISFAILSGCQNIIKALHCSLASYLVAQGNFKKAQEEIDDLLLIDVPHILKSFEENNFCVNDLILSREIACASIAIGKRSLGKTLLEVANKASIRHFDADHPISLYLSKALGRLFIKEFHCFPTSFTLDEVSLVVCSLKTTSGLLAHGNLDSHVSTQLAEELYMVLLTKISCQSHKEYGFHFSKDAKEEEKSGYFPNSPAQCLALSFSTCICILAQDSLDKENQVFIDCCKPLSEILRQVSTMSVETISCSKEIHLDPSYGLHAIAGLCMLVDVILATNALPPANVCGTLIEVMAFHAEQKKSATDDRNLEFYKDFYGNISFYVSYREIVVSGKSSRLCNVITCGRGKLKKNEDVAEKEQPLFKVTELKRSSSDETNDMSNPFILMMHRASILLDIGELRTIDKTSLDNLKVLSPRLDLVIEFVPNWSSLAKRLLIGLDVLRTIELHQSDSTEVYAYEFQKKVTFSMKTEPAILSAALHHHFKIKVLAEEVYKSGEDQMMFYFTNRNHGVLKLVSQDENMFLILTILRPSPSEVDVIPNDVTRICDDVIKKYKDHLELRPETESPWHRVTGRIEDINQETRGSTLEIAAEENLKLKRENVHLKNKIRDLSRLCEELQDNMCREIATKQSVHTTQMMVTGVDEQDGLPHNAHENEDCEDLSICSHDNEQTRSLSLEHEDKKTCSNDDRRLLEIGKAEFLWNSAERNLKKFVGVPHDLLSYKRRNVSTLGSTQLTTNSAVKGSTREGNGDGKCLLKSDFDAPSTSGDKEVIDHVVTGKCGQAQLDLVADNHDVTPEEAANSAVIKGSEEASKVNGFSAEKSFLSNQCNLKQADSSYDDSSIVERGALFEVTEDQKHDDSDSSLASFQSAKEDFTGECDDTKEPSDECQVSTASTTINNVLEHDSEERDPLKLSANGKTSTDLEKDSYNGGSWESRKGDLPSSITFTKETEQEKRTSHNEARCSSVEQKRTGSGKFRNFGTIVVDGPSSTRRPDNVLPYDDYRASLPEMVVSDGTSISGCKPPKNQREDSFHEMDRSLSLETEYIGNCRTGSQDEQLKSDSIVSDGGSFRNVPEVSQFVKPLTNETKPVPKPSNFQAKSICQSENQSIPKLVVIQGKPGRGKSSLIQTLSQLDRQTSENTSTLQEDQYDPDEPNSKPILIIGRPGIGKSLFCQKLVRDMTQGHLPYSSLSSTVQYAFLLPFRQLNIFGNKNCTLRELVNHFSLPGNNPVIDKVCFEQILKQPEQIMLVLDGYDEYLYREDILDNKFEHQYTNDPRIDMPAPVIISKVLRQNILNGARVVITSRPDEAKELRRINIDKSKEISGLSYSEMKNFIEESFKPKPMNQITSFSPGNEGELGLPGSLWSLPSQQRSTNPEYCEMPELPLPYEQKMLEIMEGPRRPRSVNTASSEGSDNGYSRLGQYFNTSLSDPRDDIPNASSETRTFGLNPSFLAKHSSDYSLQYRKRLPSPFMSMPVVDGPRRERLNITQLKESQRKEEVQTFPTYSTVFQDHCDGPQIQARNMLSSLPPKNDVEAFVTEENNQSSKTLSTLGSESPLSDLKGADVKECQNKSSLHIAKDIRDKQSAMHSAINLATTFQSCEQYEEAILYGKKCLQISKELIDKHMEMRALLNIATTYQNLQQYEDAVALNIQCQELSQEVGDTQMEARVTMNLSIIYQETRRYDEAVELSKKCIQLSRQTSDKSMEMKAARVIGLIFQTTNNHHDAIHYYRMCLEIACETTDKEMEMQVSRNLAVIHQSLNEIHEAIAYNKRSFDISKEVGDKDIELSTAKDLASSYLSLDQYNDAVAYNQRCLQIAREIGDRQMQIEIAEDLVKAYKVLGENENAIFYYKILFQIAKDKDDKQMEMQTTREIAILYQSMNQREVDAVVNNERCLKIAVELGDKKMGMDVTNDLTTICKRMDQVGHAIAHCKRCFDIANQLGDKEMAMSKAADLGDFYKNSDQLDDAVVYYERALAIAKEIGHRELELQVIREIGAIYKSLNKLDDALIYFQKSIEIAEEIGDTETEIQAIRKTRELQVQAIMEMGAIYKSLNKLDEALVYFQKSIEIAEEIGAIRTKTTACREMATILIAQDQITQAFDFYESSLKISKESGEKRMGMEISQELAALSKNMNKFEDAISYYEGSLKIAEELSNKQSEMNIYINLATLHKALDQSDKAIECAKACCYLARLLKDRNIEIKACLFLIGLYGSKGKYDEVFLYGQRCLKIAHETGDKKAEIIICLAIGEAFCSMEQLGAQPRWKDITKNITENVAYIRQAMKLDAAADGKSDLSNGEVAPATCSQRSDCSQGTSDSSRTIVEVVMQMEIPTTLNETYNEMTSLDEQQCIGKAEEIWNTFNTFFSISHNTQQKQSNNDNKERATPKPDSTVKTSSRAPSPGSKKSSKRSKTTTGRSFDKSSNCDGTTKVDNQGTPGDDFGSVSKACTLDGNLPCIDSSLDSNTEAVNTSNTSSGNHSLSTSCTESLSGRVNDNITSSGNPSLSTSCTESLSERTSDNITSSEDDNQSSNNSSLPVCHVVSSNSELSDPASDCALRSLEESVSIVRETMGSLMSRSVYDMDHQLRENIRRERELRRRREQEVIDRLLANKKQKELETQHSGLQPASLPVQIADDDLASCTHFKRGCDIFFPCCNAFYQCHRCHNQSDACEVTNSKAADATHLRCRTCMTVQEITLHGSHCTFCKRKLSEYFCGKCKHFTADDKQPYHCEPCGICRIHKDNSFHCEVCNVCLNKRLKGRHKCRPNSGHDECCICLEDAFSGCQVLPCSHKVHRECAVQMIRNGVRTCPICRAPIYE